MNSQHRLQKIRIGWFIPLQRSRKDYDRVQASVWIRCLSLIEQLRPLGYHSTINQPWAPMDIAIFLRVEGDWAQRLLRFLKWRGVKTVYTAVVNYYQRQGNADKISHLVSDQQMHNCLSMTQAADAVITVSRYLKGMAETHNNDVFYLPDSVTRSHFHFTKATDDFNRTKLKLIWSGQSTKAATIDTLHDVIQDLPVTLTIVSNAPPKLKTPFDFVPWHYQTFPQEIVKGDICISPRILDNSYDQGHSNFKIMVFLAQGMPVLASPQDSYLEVIKDGYNGFICYTADDWRNHLQTLIENRALLSDMSTNAVASAER
ncbi:MAG: glycosyltransferase [Chloroflexota bacterium]